MRVPCTFGISSKRFSRGSSAIGLMGIPTVSSERKEVL